MREMNMPADATSRSAQRLANAATTHWQRFTVAFDFPVCFTRDLFDPSNTVLIDTLCRHEDDKCHRCLVFVDDGLAASHPDLVDRIKTYAAAHAAHMQLVCDPALVPGGERIKADLHFVEQMQRMLA
ncbi:MAG: hypothetical protein AAGC70_15710, partial [Pseudomonadota bacterium]